MAAFSSRRDRNTPRLRRRFVSLAKKPSTALSHDVEVGVKWRLQRGWRASHLRRSDACRPGFLAFSAGYSDIHRAFSHATQDTY
jgi:hypothetical protein